MLFRVQLSRIKKKSSNCYTQHGAIKNINVLQQIGNLRIFLENDIAREVMFVLSLQVPHCKIQDTIYQCICLAPTQAEDDNTNRLRQ
ncbi:hypothetical protein MKW98_015862 [Papaver atlanticum]|uniref:Uncharacterized protein n=1 Tax=Papaver atlanticum TaxID=357466 RepID=A0AAD4T206_9MAGN|nr:hypothetical protein MKW98_015862 [Papaver atlanticum]